MYDGDDGDEQLLTLDVRSDLKPQVEIFTRGRPSWANGSDGVAEYEALP